MYYDIIVAGGGIAGLTAAVYGKRAGKSVLVIEKEAFGGQITASPLVENYPALGPVSGTELADRLLQGAMDAGADIELDEIVSADLGGETKKVKTAFGGEFESGAFIIATGSKHRHLGFPGEEEYSGNGISFCAVCDGAFYKGQDVAVAGGGNTALQEAVYLSEICKSVTLIHRRDSFRGEEKLVGALKSRGNVRFVMGANIVRAFGEKSLEGIEISAGGVNESLPVKALFVAVGRDPDLNIFAPFLSRSEDGYALSGEDCKTGLPGVFVAGDCRKKAVYQLTTAASDGAVAALAAVSYLS